MRRCLARRPKLWAPGGSSAPRAVALVRDGGGCPAAAPCAPPGSWRALLWGGAPMTRWLRRRARPARDARRSQHLRWLGWLAHRAAVGARRVVAQYRRRPVARRAARKLQPISPSVVCVLSQHLRRIRARLCLCGHPLSAHQHYRRATECSLCPGCPRWRRGFRRMMRDVKGLLHAVLPTGAELEWMRPPGRRVPVRRPVTSP